MIAAHNGVCDRDSFFFHKVANGAGSNMRRWGGGGGGGKEGQPFMDGTL